MKKTSLFLSLLLAGSFCQVAQAAPTTAITAQVKANQRDYYDDGVLDGKDAAAGYAAQYGKGTQAYRNAISAAAADARYQARQSEPDVAEYYYGYINGLNTY